MKAALTLANRFTTAWDRSSNIPPSIVKIRRVKSANIDAGI